MTEDDASSDFIEPGSDETSVDTTTVGISSDYGSILNNESLLGSVTSSVYANRIEHGRQVVTINISNPPL